MTTQNKPTYSVIIPTTGHHRKRLRQAVSSILGQQQHEALLESVHIAVDTEEDDRVGVIRKMFSEDSRVTVCHAFTARSAGSARNFGIDDVLSCGAKPDYIAFLDDDDVFYKRKMDTQIHMMRLNNSGLSMSCIDEIAHDRYGKAITNKTSKLGKVTVKNVIQGHVKSFTPTLVIRREELEQMQGFDNELKYYEDHEFLIRYIDTFGENVTVSHKPLVIRNKYPDGASSRKPWLDVLRNRKRFYQKIKHHDFSRVSFFKEVLLETGGRLVR